MTSSVDPIDLSSSYGGASAAPPQSHLRLPGRRSQNNAELTVASALSMALTNATASEVQDRTVSVRPSLNIRVIDDS